MTDVFKFLSTKSAGMAQDLKPWYITSAVSNGRKVVGAVGSIQDTSLSFNQRTVSPGATTNVEWKPARNLLQKIEAMYLTFNMANTGMNTITVYNPYDLISSIELHVNGNKMIEYDQYQIMSLVADYFTQLRNLATEGESELLELQAAQDWSAGTVVANASTVSFELNLYILFPFLDNWITNSRQNIGSISLHVTFRPSYQTIDNAQFCRSNMNANAYDPLYISFTDIALRWVATSIVDPRFTSVSGDSFYPCSRWDVLRFTNKSWNVPGTDSISISLDKFPKRQLIQSLTMMIRPTGLQTGYDSASASRWLSGSRYVTFSFNRVGYTDSLVDFTQHPTRLRQFERRQQQMLYSHSLPLTTIEGTDGSSYYFMRNLTRIDFRNIDIDYDNHRLIGGLNTGDGMGDNWEFNFICREAINANCEILLFMESKRFFTINTSANGAPTEIPYEKLLRE